MTRRVKAEFGTLDALFVNAGINGFALFELMSEESLSPPTGSVALMAAMSGTISQVTKPWSAVSSSMLSKDRAVRSGVSTAIVTTGTSRGT